MYACVRVCVCVCVCLCVCVCVCVNVCVQVICENYIRQLHQDKDQAENEVCMCGCVDV